MEEEKKEEQFSEAQNQKSQEVGQEVGKGVDELTELAEIRQRYEQEIEELKGHLQRERADFINYRKRVQQEKAALSTEIAARLLLKMLPVLDAFEQLFSMRQSEKSQQAMDNFFEGVAIIRKQLWEVFKAEGLEEINPLNQEFDSNFMEALDYKEGDVSKEMVGLIYQKGYKIPSRVLRPARVQVIRPAKPTEEQITSEDKKENLENQKLEE